MTQPVDFLAIRPHPDDESSATGGLLARYHAEGRRTAVITCTGGEEGEIHDPDLVYEEAFPRLAEIRERELRAACEILGVSELRLLGYRDSGMVDTEPNNHPDAFMRVDLDVAGARVAALIRDLKARGLLDDTLVIWTSEFGRTPFTEANTTARGRDHNPLGFTSWLAGAGVKPGTRFGATDELGHRAVEDPVTLYDFHATILHLLGLDHERLTFYHNGIRRRLTDVHGRVIREILA